MDKINWRLYGAVFSINIVSVTSGIAYAWTSPVLPKLNNNNDLSDNPFGRIITPLEESFLTSVISVGASIGPILAALIVDKIGRKKTLLLLAFPIILSHLILAFASNVNLYLVARFLLGLSVGSVYSLVPIYVGEIAEDCNRGALGCCMTIGAGIGTLFTFAVGSYMTIQNFCLLLIVPAVVFLILVGFFAPESPYYLLMLQKDEEAKIALKKLRKNFIEKELKEMKQNVEASISAKVKLKDTLKSKAIQKGLFIGSGLMLFQQCSGVTVILSYMQSIFEASGSTLSPKISTIIVALLQLTANLVASQLVDRLGRKVLLLTSLIGGLIAHSLIGLYFYLKTNNFDDVVSYLSWLPVCSLILYIVLFMCGLGPVTWALIGELFPTHFRSRASTFVTVICLFLAFILTLIFPNLNQMIGMAFSFWIFAAFCALGIIFVVKVVPETKKKSLYEIQLMLGNNNKF